MIFKTSFSEHFRPTRLADVILPNRVKVIVQGIITQQNMPNLIFHSSGFGFGKTSLAINLAKHTGCNVVFKKGGDRLGVAEISTLATEIQSGVPAIDLFDSVDDQKFKHYPFHTIVIIDEADAMSRHAQTALKNLMESLDDVARFIFTTNHVQKLDEGLYKSGRAMLIDFAFNKAEQAEMIRDSIKLVQTVCNEVNMAFDMDAAVLLLTKTMPSFRKTLLTLETIKTFYNSFTVDTVKSCILDVSYNDYYKAIDDRDYLKAEKWITTHIHLLTVEFYESLSFYYVNRLLKNNSLSNLMEFLVVLNDYNTKHDNAVSITVHICALSAQLMSMEFLYV